MVIVVLCVCIILMLFIDEEWLMMRISLRGCGLGIVCGMVIGLILWKMCGVCCIGLVLVMLMRLLFLFLI